MEVTDEQLKRIKEDGKYYLDADFAKTCFDSEGNNAVINILVGAGSVKDIVKGLKILRSRYKTVSFWNRGHQKFYGGNCVLHTNS